MGLRRTAMLIAVTGASVLLTAGPAAAAPCTRTWDGGAGTAAWETAANWDGNVLPGPADVACLPTGAVAVATGPTEVLELGLTGGSLTVDGSLTAARLLVESGAVSGGGTVAVGEAEGIVKSTAGTVTIPPSTRRPSRCRAARWPSSRPATHS